MTKDVRKNGIYSVERDDSWFIVWIKGMGKHKMFQEPNNCIWFYLLSSLDVSIIDRTR